MSEPRICSLYLTAPDLECARRLARTLLDERLIACANVFPAGTSLYRWRGELQEEPEVVLLAKTRAELVARAVARASELHPYEVPCVVAFPVVAGEADYLAWVAAETDGG